MASLVGSTKKASLPPRLKVAKVDPKSEIIDAAIELLGHVGMRGFTQRKLAKVAGKPLAVVTYHFRGKRQIIAAAAERLFQTYILTLNQAAEKARSGQECYATFTSFLEHCFIEAVTTDRLASLAWCEILLDCGRSGVRADLARNWHDRQTNALAEVLEAYQEPDPLHAARATLDCAAGLLFMVLGLNLRREEVELLFDANSDPSQIWKPDGLGIKDLAPRVAAGNKSKETQARILDVAVALLLEGGADAISHRAVAANAALTIAAPAYHFKSIQTLIACAQFKLFESAKARYRAGLGDIKYAADLGGLADLSAAILTREVTEHGALNLATYSVWLDAGRRVSLRYPVWSAIFDQAQSWKRQLDRFGIHLYPAGPFLVQAIFLGKLIRLLSSGVPMAEIARCRPEFAYAFDPSRKAFIGFSSSSIFVDD